MIRVLLVEDEPVIRAGLRAMLDSLGRYRVVGEAADGAEALDLAMKLVPEVIVTDIRMPGTGGLEFIEQLDAVRPRPQIIVVSGYGDFVYAQAALRLGVADYLLKPVARTDLARALASAVPGEGPEPRRSDDQSPSGHEAVRRVEEYVVDHLDGDLSLGAVARQVHLNPQYLSALFKRETGRNYVDHVTSTRVARACQLLADTDLHVYEIARLVGYQSPQHFMGVFKAVAGATANEWRRSVRTARP